MRRTGLLLIVILALALVFGLVWAPVAQAEESQVIDVLIGKILERYSVGTNYGNIYFNKGDLRRLVDAAAKMRPVNLGSFTTDAGVTVKVRAGKFDRGMVTLIITR